MNSAIVAANILQRLSSSQGVPQSSDALVNLNGLIEQDGGNYYFTDVSGNNRRFLITNYDFPTGWVRGFPYKSAATISAPAGDATLIAADLNNYFYTGGVPNAINVVSLFQDIDYEHKFFTRHASRVVDENNEEVTDNRVLELVIYSSVRTGSDLTACQTYFSVPTEATSNVRWVTKAGNDSNGGTKASPWLTLEKATQSATNGETVYVKTGAYQANHTGTTGYWMITRSVTVVGVGRVLETSANTSFAAFINAAVTLTIKNIDIGNAVASSTATIAMGAYASTLTFDRCRIKNGAFGISAASAVSLTVTNCIYSGMTNRMNSTGNTTFTFTGNYSTDNVQCDINSATALRTSVVQYNKMRVVSMTNGFAVNLNVSYNNAGAITIDGDADVTAATSVLRITRNILNRSGVETKIHVLHNYYDTQISNNTLTAAITGASIRTAEQTTSVINDNILIGGALPAWIVAGATTSLQKNITIEDNYISSGGGTTPLYIGDDVEAVQVWFDTYTGTIRRNTVIGANSIANHGITVFNQSNVSIMHNYSEGFTFGCIVKCQGLDLTDAPIMYNVTRNCQNGIAAKGGANQRIIGNTIINPVAYGLLNSFNPFGSHGSTGTIFKNNIIVETGAASSYVAIANESSCSIDSDNNNIYSLNNSNKFNNGGANLTFAQWQALGRDASSITTNPNLDSDGIPASPILIGADLGASYDTGLDVTTTWGSSTSVPVIVTRDQQADAPWEVGAYVQR